jgi:mRNA-degrading endonuclease RelE of RelBE toxin-antitoxin system
MIYKAEFAGEFLRTMAKLKKKDASLFSRLQDIVAGILFSEAILV